MFDNVTVTDFCNDWVGKIFPEYAEFGNFVEQFYDEVEYRLNRLRSVATRVQALPEAGPLQPTDGAPAAAAAAPTMSSSDSESAPAAQPAEKSRPRPRRRGTRKNRPKNPPRNPRETVTPRRRRMLCPRHPLPTPRVLFLSHGEKDQPANRSSSSCSSSRCRS
jgi:hypothetical protein